MLANRTHSPSRSRLTGEATAPFAVGALVAGVAFLLFHASLPSRIATHFTGGGSADRYSSPAAALGQYMLLFAIQAAGSLGVVFSVKATPRGARGLRAFCWGLAAATTYDLVATLWIVSDSQGHSVHLPSYQLVVDVLVGAAAGAAAWFASRGRA